MARAAIIPEKILNLLKSNHMLSADQILKLLQSNGKKYNKTSVYRSLDKLLDEGKVCKQAFDNNKFLYELRDDHHDHAVCNSCKKVTAVHCQNDDKKEISGFKVDHHHTTLFGLCEDCLKNEVT